MYLKETKVEIKTEFLYYEMHTKLTQWYMAIIFLFLIPEPGYIATAVL